MNQKNKLLILFLFGLIALFSIANKFIFKPIEINIDLKKFPLVIMQMHGQTFISEGLDRFFTKDEYLNRIYKRGNSEIYVHIAQPKKAEHFQHHPYVCFDGSGLKIKEKIPFKLIHKGKNINAQKLITEDSITYYWFSNYKYTWFDHSLQEKLIKFFNRDWHTIKYMFTAEIKDGNIKAADKLIYDFIQAIPEEFII
ncbi:MAG: hypothetical protein KKA19_06215 [Candidatus Margulisbacteria bacterium]|nr:hypothetical protein [Candidatus Margulisiibacteriota bacterium]